MRKSAFHYELPAELIAHEPPPDRDGARLLVLAASGAPEHRWVRELDALVPAGALLVVNDTRVVPARLLGRKSTSGGRVELLLVERVGPAGATERWRALGRASKGLKEGALLAFDDTDGRTLLTARVLVHQGAGDGLVEVELAAASGEVAGALEVVGHVPLPPYMRRPDRASDRERYQTVFAKNPGAVAAPTAGLHLSEALLARLEARGVERANTTLHVGLGTFQPVTASDFDDHPMHSERFEVSEATVDAIARARDRGAPVVAVGTTVVRALESAADPTRSGHVVAQAGSTRLLIQPGYRFRVVDRLLTNFHLPESTLLALVSAFAGRERVLSAYAEAVARRYRFFSYGDAMLLEAGTEPPFTEPSS